MNELDCILLRRQILDWRDKYIDETQHHFCREISVLFDALDLEIEKMTTKDIFFKQGAFQKQKIQPVYVQWVKREANVIIDSAQFELDKIHQQALHYQKCESTLNHQDDTEQIKDAVASGIATGGAFVAIPAFASWSVISAGGIAGLLGATVISWPIVLTGVAVTSGLLAFGGNKAINLKSRSIQRVKDKTRENIREQVLGNKTKNTVCQELQVHFETIANNILRELNS